MIQVKPTVGLGLFGRDAGHQRGKIGLFAQTTRGKARVRKGNGRAGKVDHLHVAGPGLQAVDRRINAQFLARWRIKAFDQIPSGIQRRLVIHQPHPKRGQRVDMGLVAAIGAAHFDEFLHPRFGENGGHVVGPIRQGGQFAGQRGQLALHEVAERLPQRVDVFAIAVHKIHRRIQNPIDVLLKAKAIIKGKGQHAGARVIQAAPYPRPP